MRRICKLDLWRSTLAVSFYGVLELGNFRPDPTIWIYSYQANGLIDGFNSPLGRRTYPTPQCFLDGPLNWSTWLKFDSECWHGACISLSIKATLYHCLVYGRNKCLGYSPDYPTALSSPCIIQYGWVSWKLPQDRQEFCAVFQMGCLTILFLQEP